MGIALGIENKRQVYLVAALLLVVVLMAAWEIRGAMTDSTTPVRTPAAITSAAHQTSDSVRRPGLAGLEPKLQIEHLARSEDIKYGTTGRNIFSDMAVPVKIEAPIAPARPAQTALSVSSEPPTLPAIDIKYLGYVLSRNKTYNALVIHGDDSFIAKTGEIVFHYYKVGTIQPSRVQVTDLRFNNTQTIALSEK